MASALVALADVKEELGITDASQDAILAKQILRASQRVETYCGRAFRLVSRAEDHDGGGETIALDVRPLVTLTSVSDRMTDPPTAESAANITAESGPAILRRTDRTDWPRGRQRWRVAYQAGFAAAPDDVKEAVIALVAAWRADKTGAMESETIGAYSYTRAKAENGIPAGVASLLAPYRRRPL